MYTVYALYNPQYKIYVGFTSNLEQRLLSHNDLGKKGWTVKHRPWDLYYQERFEDKQEAMRREKELKTGKGRDYLRELLDKYLNKS